MKRFFEVLSNWIKDGHILDVKLKELNGVYWVSINTRGLLIDSFYNTNEDFGKIEFNGVAWSMNDGKTQLPADMWINIISNCIGLMNIK